jgi:putative transposon-encoded protein
MLADIATFSKMERPVLASMRVKLSELTVDVQRVSTWLSVCAAVKATVQETPTRQVMAPVGKVVGLVIVICGDKLEQEVPTDCSLRAVISARESDTAALGEDADLEMVDTVTVVGSSIKLLVPKFPRLGGFLQFKLDILETSTKPILPPPAPT